MNNKRYQTKEEILAKGREAIGIPLRYIDKHDRLKSGKGAVGSVLEESWFGYSINSESRPDFKDAGVELKATPFIYTKNGRRAKERLVCNIIDYMNEYKNSFHTSSFWKKCNTMLIMPYEYKEGISKGDYKIAEAMLFSFPVSDLIIIKNDWEMIISKIREGKAHELSESDTLYLGACTKGATAATSLRKQPFSDILAKQRAYSLKQSYMTYILNSYLFGSKKDESIVKDPGILENTSFENYIINRIRPFIGRTQASLMIEFNIANSPKNINELLVAKMLGIEGKITATEEFKKANIVPKTIRVNHDGTITEHMSFPAFNFKKLVNEDWEDCELKGMMEQTKFLFIIFRFTEDGELVFDDLMFWNMPERDFEELQRVWERTVKVITNGVEFRTSGKRTFNNLPNASESHVSHVRPHAKDSTDQLELPDGRSMPKQSFWLNNSYIKEQIESYRNTN